MLGLSKPHIPPCRVKVAVGAQYVELIPPRHKDKPRQVGGGRRGTVTGFSRQSRRRMLNLLNQVPTEAHKKALFITLTYPSEYPADDVAKQHLDTFSKRIARKWPQAAFVWRIEAQKRGAPHFHLLVYGVEFIPKAWLSRSWYEIVGSQDEKHLRAGTQVAYCHTIRQVLHYASKYAAKETEDVRTIEGRQWGVKGRANLPIHLVVLSLSLSDWFSIKRTMMSRMSKRSPRIAIILRMSFPHLAIYISSRVVFRLLMGQPHYNLKEGLKQLDFIQSKL